MITKNNLKELGGSVMRSLLDRYGPRESNDFITVKRRDVKSQIREQFTQEQLVNKILGKPVDTTKLWLLETTTFTKFMRTN